MKPADEVRSLTCHCERIACRHHTGAPTNPARVPAGYVIARRSPRTSTATITITPDIDRTIEAVRHATHSITRPIDEEPA